MKNVVDFAKEILGITLWPMQEILLQHIFNQGDSSEKTSDILVQGRDYARDLLPFIETHEKHHGVALMLGQRSGNSVIARVAALYEVYRLVTMGNPQKFFSIMETDNIRVLLLCGPEGNLVDFQSQGIDSLLMSKAFPVAPKKSVTRNRNGTPTSVTYEFKTEEDVKEGRRGSIRLAVESCRKSPDSHRGANNIRILVDSCWDEKSLEEVILAARPSMCMFLDPATRTQWAHLTLVGSHVPLDIREGLTRLLNGWAIDTVAYNTSYVNPNGYVIPWEKTNPEGCRLML
jgi:hypothetical protein